MNQNFIRAVNAVLKHEGGYSNDEDDPGNWTGGEKGKGELVGTKYGISAASHPVMDIKSLSVDAAKAIYWRDYWLKNGCELLPPAVALVYFDACVNQGPYQASVALQRAVNVKADGVVGPVTLAAVRSEDQYDVVSRLVAARAWQYTGAKGFQKYGKGWLTRLIDISREAYGK